MNNHTYWFITVFRKFDDRFGISGSRTWGFYSNKDDALDTLINNRTDLWETIYDYAVIEPYYEGISGYDFDEDRMWFKYNEITDCYDHIDEPEKVKHYVGFAIG